MSVPRGCRRGRARGAPPSLRGGPARHPAMTSLLPVLVLVLVPVLVLVAPLVTVGP